MCIIVAKPKNIDMPSEDIIRQCFVSNPDGAGFMYVKDNQVIVDKGYMTVDDLLYRLELLKKELNSKDLKDKAIVLHFRIGTAGKNDKETTHPFIITDNFDKLRATKITSSVGMVHNGIISHYSYKNTTLSDTQLFIQKVVYPISKLCKKFYKNDDIMDMLEDLSDSKLCFLDNEENIYYCGDKVEEDGVIYSNSSFRSYKLPSPSKHHFSHFYDDFFEDCYDGYYLNDVRDFLMIVVNDDYVSYDYGKTFVKNTGIKYLDEFGYLYSVDSQGFLTLISTCASVYNREYEEIEFAYGN